MNIAELKELALHSARGTAPATFSAENVNAAFTDGLKELASNYYEFMENRYTIYSILTETVDDIVPNKVIDAVGIFAEVRTAKQGEKVLFKTKLGKERAKKFLTRVGLSGVYETFRLDNSTFEVPAYAIGGACSIDYERMLDGAENMAELMDIMTEGLTDSIYIEVQKALRAVNDRTDASGQVEVALRACAAGAVRECHSVVAAVVQRGRRRDNRTSGLRRDRLHAQPAGDHDDRLRPLRYGVRQSAFCLHAVAQKIQIHRAKHFFAQ